MARFPIFAAALLAFLTPAAYATADSFDHESPQDGAALFLPPTEVVRADAIMTDEEIHHSGVPAGMLMRVSVFPRSGMIDPSSRND